MAAGDLVDLVNLRGHWDMVGESVQLDWPSANAGSLAEPYTVGPQLTAPCSAPDGEEEPVGGGGVRHGTGALSA